MQIDVPDTRFVLRPVEKADAADWYAYLALPETVANTSWDVRSAADVMRLIGQYHSVLPATAMRFAICEADDRRLIGTVGFHSILHGSRTAELAYDLHPAQWGRGVMARSAEALVRWGFETQRYVRIQACVHPRNARSIAVLERLGFDYEGRLRNYRLVGGVPADFLMYARLPE